jgi:peptide/nickel transport system permease protein
MDVPLRRIIVDDILPNVMPYILISFVNTARGVIFGSVALFYLGVLPVSFPNWGLMLSRAYGTGGAIYSFEYAYWIIFAMLAIVLLSFGLVLFSQGTERLFNPRIRARHAESIEETDPTTGD